MLSCRDRDIYEVQKQKVKRNERIKDQLKIMHCKHK